MKKKLTTAILSLTLAFALSVSATFAWFSVTTVASVEEMELTVQTVGSLQIRPLDWAPNDTEGGSPTQLDHFEANPRRYTKSVAVPATEGLNQAGDTWDTGDRTTSEDFDRDGLEPVTLVGNSFLDNTGTEFDPAWTQANIDHTNATEPVLNTDEMYNAPDGSPVAAELMDSGHDIFMRPTLLDDDNDTWDYAQERNHYGRFDIDMMYMDDATNKTAVMGATTLDINTTVEDTTTIAGEERVYDFLSAFKVAIFEIDPTGDTVNADMNTSETGDYYTLVTLGAFETGSGETYETPVPTWATADTTFDFTWYSDLAETTAFDEDFGGFTENEARYFSIVYYIDGNVPATYGTDHNHLSSIDFGVALDFNVDDLT